MLSQASLNEFLGQSRENQIQTQKVSSDSLLVSDLKELDNELRLTHRIASG